MERLHLSLPDGAGACFQQADRQICDYLADAQQHIQAAICWFSHREIFSVLLERLKAGVSVELLLEYDTQNIRADGLDFQRFIQMGGHLYASRDAGLMHHKFAIIDSCLLLTGSCNWTYNSNAENLLILHHSALIQSFQEEFLRLKGAAQRVFQVRLSDAKVFSAFPLFENTRFPISDLRKKIGGGAGVWVVNMNLITKHQAIIFKNNDLPFDIRSLLHPYWAAYRIWDESLFKMEMERLMTAPVSTQTLRHLRCWALRMRIGDVVFGVKGRSRMLVAIGIIQSHPQPCETEPFSSFRSVQWLKILPEASYFLPEKISAQEVARYRGSALRVLQEVIGQNLLY